MPTAVFSYKGKVACGLTDHTKIFLWVYTFQVYPLPLISAPFQNKIEVFLFIWCVCRLSFFSFFLLHYLPFSSPWFHDDWTVVEYSEVLLIVNQNNSWEGEVWKTSVVCCPPKKINKQLKKSSYSREIWRYHKWSVSDTWPRAPSGRSHAWGQGGLGRWEPAGLLGRESGLHGWSKKCLTASAAILRYVQLLFVLVQTCSVLVASSPPTAASRAGGGGVEPVPIVPI